MCSESHGVNETEWISFIIFWYIHKKGLNLGQSLELERGLTSNDKKDGYVWFRRALVEVDGADGNHTERDDDGDAAGDGAADCAEEKKQNFDQKIDEVSWRLKYGNLAQIECIGTYISDPIKQKITVQIVLQNYYTPWPSVEIPLTHTTTHRDRYGRKILEPSHSRSAGKEAS